MMDKKYISHKQAVAIAETGLWNTETLNEEDAVYCDCPDRNISAMPSTVGEVIKLQEQGAPGITGCPRFTLDEAMRWLREEAGIHIQVNAIKRVKWSYDLVDIIRWKNEKGDYHNCVPERKEAPTFDSYDEALSDAIDKAVAIFAPTEWEIDESEYPSMSEDEYNKFCNDSESMKVYDGRGTYDLYECKGCSHRIITTYADKGVTPFTTRCPKCGEIMTHTLTFNSVPDGVGVVKWVRPTYAQYCKLPIATREHVNNGGLIMETDLDNK